MNVLQVAGSASRRLCTEYIGKRVETGSGIVKRANMPDMNLPCSVFGATLIVSVFWCLTESSLTQHAAYRRLSHHFASLCTASVYARLCAHIVHHTCQWPLYLVPFDSSESQKNPKYACVTVYGNH